MIDVVCPTEADTRAVGRRLASLLRAGDIVLLAGDLGAGKTVLAGGVGEGLGVDHPVVSPTFVIVRRHQGFMPLIHADLYRLGSSAEVEDLELGGEGADGVVLVEWGDAVEQAFGDDVLLIRFAVGESGARTLTFIPRGSWLGRPIAEVMP